MKRYWRKKKHYKYHAPKKMTKEERAQWLFAGAVFIVVLAAMFVYYFFAHCVFEWPIRWDIRQCAHEQVAPAQQKAAEEASKFAP